MTPEQLDEIRQRADAATPGPWSAYREARDFGFSYDCLIKTPYLDPRDCGDGITLRYGGIVNCIRDEENEKKNARCLLDAAFIAHARADIPALLAHIAEQDAQLDAARAEVERLREVLTVVTEQAEGMIAMLYQQDLQEQGWPQFIADARAALEDKS